MARNQHYNNNPFPGRNNPSIFKKNQLQKENLTYSTRKLFEILFGSQTTLLLIKVNFLGGKSTIKMII